MQKTAFKALTAVILVLSGASAQFYNSIQHLIGERAAGMAGAYTAIADNSIALWYNPAGLSLMKAASLNVSATSYSYLTSKVKGYRQFEKFDNSPREDLDLEENDFSIVGTSLVYGKNISDKMGIGYGIFAPIQENVNTVFGGNIDGFFSDQEDSLGVKINSVEISSSSNTYSKNYVGLVGFGYKLFDWFQFGLSLGISQFSMQVSAAQYNYYDWQQNGASKPTVLFLRVETNELSAYTGFFGVGFKANIGKHHLFGANFRTPSLVLAGELNSTINTDYSITRRTRTLDFFTKQFESTAQGGYTYIIPENFAFSIDIAPSIEAFLLGTGVPFLERPLSYFNILIGIEKMFMDKYWIRAGFLSDLNNKDDIENDPKAQSQIDYAGGTLSFSIPKTFEVKTAEGFQNKTLHSSFGLYYRFGTGERRVLRYRNQNLRNPVPATVSQNVHNISVYIGESLSF